MDCREESAGDAPDELACSLCALPRTRSNHTSDQACAEPPRRSSSWSYDTRRSRVGRLD
jgi:hypothetical protein